MDMSWNVWRHPNFFPPSIWCIGVAMEPAQLLIIIRWGKSIIDEDWENRDLILDFFSPPGPRGETWDDISQGNNDSPPVRSRKQNFIFQKKVIHCLFCPPPRTLGQLCPWGSWMRPKFSSRSRMSLRALRDLKYGRGALATCSPTPGSTLPVGVMASLAAWDPGIGSNFCSSSYAARVKPNCGDERMIRAGPPFQKALKPSSFQIVFAQCRSEVYLV